MPKGILNFKVLKAKSSTVKASDKLNESPMKSEFDKFTMDTDAAGNNLDSIADPRVAVVWKGKQCISDIPEEQGEFEKVFDQEFDLKIDGDASLQERVKVKVLDGETEVGSLKMKVKSLMDAEEQWYPLYKGTDCVGQLYIGSTYTEGAKYTSKIHKNWEAVDEEVDDDEEPQYDMLQQMVVGEAAPVDPKGAAKLDRALNPQPKLDAKVQKPGCFGCCKPKAPSLSPPKVKAPKLKAPKMSAPKLEGPKMPKANCWGAMCGGCGALACCGPSLNCCKPKLAAPVIKPDLKMKAPKMSAPKLSAPKAPMCGSCCKPKIKPPSISPPKMKTPKMSAPKVAAPKAPMCGSCCGPKMPKYQPQQNAFAVIPLDNTDLKMPGKLEMNAVTNTVKHQTPIPGYAIVPISQAQSYALANSAHPNKKIVPYDKEQLEQGITNLGVVPMSVPEEPEKKIVKGTNELPDQKKKTEHQTSTKFVEQSVKKTPRNELPPQKQAKQVHNSNTKYVEKKQEPLPVQKKKTAKNSSPAPKLKQPKMSSPTIKEPKQPEFKAPPKTPKYIAPAQEYVAPPIARPQTVPQYFEQPPYIPQPVYKVPFQPQRATPPPFSNPIDRPQMPDISVPKMPKNGVPKFPTEVPQTQLNLNNGQFEDYDQYNDQYNY